MRRNCRSKCFFGMIVIALATFTANAQTPSPSPSASSLEKDFLKNILQDQKAIWTAPFRVQRADSKWIVPGSIGLTALFTTDRITGDEMAESVRQVAVSRAISHAGSTYVLGAVAGTFYFLGREKNNTRARETGLLSAEALVNSVLVASELKLITQRARPMAGVERSEFFDGGNSFPSGHSTQAWAVATIIASEYKHRRAVQIAAFATASAVSVARLGEHKHYISDVIAGSALGYAIGKYVYHKRHREPLDTSDVNGPINWWPAITPEVNRRTREYGLALRWSF
jgi:membrane-associated phospholipid phosphatase